MRHNAFLRLREINAVEVRGVVRRTIAHEPQRFERELLDRQHRQRRRQLALDNQEPRAAIAENVFELRAARGGVDRNGDGAEPAASEDRQEEFGAVAAHDGDPVAGLRAGGGKRGGMTRGRRAGLGIGQRHAPDRHEAARPVALGLARQHFWQRALRRRKKRREAARETWASHFAAYSRLRTLGVAL